MPIRSLPVDAVRGSLLLHRTADGDYAVEVETYQHGRLPVGRIMLAARPPAKAVWFWTITGPHVPATALSGEAASLEQAREAFRQTWDALLAKAAQEGRAVVWRGSVAG